VLDAHIPPGDATFQFWIAGLPGSSPRHAPQSAYRQDDGKEPGHADRDQHPGGGDSLRGKK
jgi:hypothetical protein